MKIPIHYYFIIALLIGGFIFSGYIFITKTWGKELIVEDIPTYDAKGLVVDLLVEDNKEEVKPKTVEHLETPESVKAVYMTNCVAITPSLKNKLINLINETELNSVVLDLKDYTGTISFTPKDQALIDYDVSRCPIGDLEKLVKEFHDNDIYVIGRVTVFQDPLFTKYHPEEGVKTASNPSALWQDKKGLNYIDPASKKAHDHVISIALDAYNQGVDEINFDYIRYPSDGNMKDILFPLSGGSKPKPEILEKFFAYLHNELKDTGMITSADVFGVVTTSTKEMGIGQFWERFLPYFDYIAPMIYPSHYYAGFEGFSNPNLHPYEVVKGSLDRAVLRTVATSTIIKTLDGKPIASTTPQLYTKKAFSKAKIRPWLQDFDYPVPYTPDMVEAQIKATYDAGLNSWMMWDPTNTYTRSVYLE